MKSILVPTDFSKCAQAAESYAMKIAETTNAQIHFLHLLNTPTNWVRLPIEKEKLYPETKERISHARTKLRKLVKQAERKGLESEQFLVFDEGKEEILNHAKSHKHTLIVMGSSGASGIKEVFGSNAQKVIRDSMIPVIVVKEKRPKSLIRNIVFASNFDKEAQKPFRKVVNFADLMGASIHLLYVNMPFNFLETDEVMANMEAFHKKCPRGNCTMNIYDAYNEERGIQKFANQINADIVALTTHGKKGFMRMISASITECLVNHAEFPVFSVNVNSK